MATLKQRARQCSAFIPANQYYVPARHTHQLLSPTRPAFRRREFYNASDERSVADAVKAWLESSPTSIVDGCRSPTSPRSSSDAFFPSDSFQRTSASSRQRRCVPPEQSDCQNAEGSFCVFALKVGLNESIATSIPQADLQENRKSGGEEKRAQIASVNGLDGRSDDTGSEESSRSFSSLNQEFPTADRFPSCEDSAAPSCSSTPWSKFVKQSSGQEMESDGLYHNTRGHPQRLTNPTHSRIVTIGDKDEETSAPTHVKLYPDSRESSIWANGGLTVRTIAFRDANPTHMVLEKLKKDKLLAKAAAWELAKNSRFMSSYTQEECTWEDRVSLKPLEQEGRSQGAGKVHQAEVRKTTSDCKRVNKTAQSTDGERRRPKGFKLPRHYICF